ncbi:MAG: cupin domain-containing protein [Anditalea sp.]
MAKTNQVIVNKTFGDKLKFLTTSGDSNGKLISAEIRIKPGGQGPPEHYHPIQTETFEVVKGKLGLIQDGKKMILNPGEKHSVPPNAKHTFWNASNEEELIIIGESSPALKFEYFLETMYSLDYQGKTNKEGLPNPLQFAAILNEHYGEMFVVTPPIGVQKFMAKVVGRFAKSIGYKGYIPFPKN